jgi:hypothetical protein
MLLESSDEFEDLFTIDKTMNEFEGPCQCPLQSLALIVFYYFLNSRIYVCVVCAVGTAGGLAAAASATNTSTRLFPVSATYT